VNEITNRNIKRVFIEFTIFFTCDERYKYNKIEDIYNSQVYFDHELSREAGLKTWRTQITRINYNHEGDPSTFGLRTGSEYEGFKIFHLLVGIKPL
jgi:hypothetical protein